MQIDLRSDTITKPSAEMLEAMFRAEVGDDVYEEDPTVNQLQVEVAAMFGMDSALFCPSGTMTNQIGIKILTQPQDEVICYKGSHIYKYEGGGLAYNAQVSARLVDAHFGKLTTTMVKSEINPVDIHFPKTTVVALENTVNRGGGAVYSMEEIRAIAVFSKANGLKMHLDGARVWNALVAQGQEAKEYGQYFDTISVCLSKGLGCPVGSLILTKKEDAFYAKRLRKVMGGAMRQAGFLAAAGLYALNNNIERLKEDHQKAKIIGEILEKASFIQNVAPVQSNIILMAFEKEEVANTFQSYLLENQVLVGRVSSTQIRMVTHLDFGEEQLAQVVQLLKRF